MNFQLIAGESILMGMRALLEDKQLEIVEM